MNLGMMFGGEVPNEKLPEVAALMRSMLDGTLTVEAKLCCICRNRLSRYVGDRHVTVRKKTQPTGMPHAYGTLVDLESYAYGVCQKDFVSRASLVGSFCEKYLNDPNYTVVVQNGFVVADVPFIDGMAVQEFSARQKEGIKKLLGEVTKAINNKVPCS
jgi:hypothetical protein